MKNIILVLIIILVFFTCGIVGYQIAIRIDPSKTSLQTAGPAGLGKGEQHNLVIVQVDQITNPQPRLVSVWFASLFFMEDVPPTLTFGQLYPTQSNNTLNQSIARSFSLDGQGDPSAGFWQNLRAYKIKWDGYLLVDQTTVQRVLEWINGPGDYLAVFTGETDRDALRKQVVKQSCSAMVGIDKRQTAPLEWGDLVPSHFRTNLRMEAALAYWNRITTASTARCEVLPSR